MASGHMLRVGPFVFSLTTAAYQEFTRADNWRWVSIERIGNELANQYLGPGERTITLTGVVFALFDPSASPGNPGAPVGTKQLAALRGVGEMASPQVVTDGQGNTFGRWVILSIEERASNFMDHGAPKKQEFNVVMRFYGSGGSGAGAFAFGGMGSMLSVAALFSSAIGLQNKQFAQTVTAGDTMKNAMASVGVDLGVSLG